MGKTGRMVAWVGRRMGLVGTVGPGRGCFGAVRGSLQGLCWVFGIGAWWPLGPVGKGVLDRGRYGTAWEGLVSWQGPGSLFEIEAGRPLAPVGRAVPGKGRPGRAYSSRRSSGQVRPASWT